MMQVEFFVAHEQREPKNTCSKTSISYFKSGHQASYGGARNIILNCPCKITGNVPQLTRLKPCFHGIEEVSRKMSLFKLRLSVPLHPFVQATGTSYMAVSMWKRQPIVFGFRDISCT